MYIIKIKGIEVTCETAQEVAELIKQLSNSGVDIATTEKSTTELPIGRYIRFLNNLVKAGDDGMLTKDLARSIRIKGPKGLSAVVNNVVDNLSGHDISHDDIVIREGTPEGRMWRYGPKTKEALTLLRKKRDEERD